jgi:hypothetical protein
MAAMKVTISAAMRARDVSRPHAEHLAFAEAAEADAVRGRPGGPAVPAASPVLADAAGAGAAGAGAAGAGAAGAGAASGEAGDGGRRREVAPPDERRTPDERRQSERTDVGATRPGGARRRWRSRGSGRGRTSR